MDGIKNEIIGSLADAGILVSPDALSEIMKTGNPSSIVGHVIAASISPKSGILRLDSDEIQKIILRNERKTVRNNDNFSIINDFFKSLGTKGDVEDFTAYMLSRYKKLSKLIFSVHDFHEYTRISDLVEDKKEQHVIGMVQDVVPLPNGNKILIVDDPTGILEIFIPADSDFAKEVFLKDEVIGIKGKYAVKQVKNRTHNSMYPSDIVRPALFKQKRNSAKNDIWALFISDIHLGSNTFLKKEWEYFISWLEGSFRFPDADSIREKLGYIIIVGDIVDGVGIYPGQEADLEIDDLREQHIILAEYLRRIPKNVKIIILPGNHDAVRGAEPQPPIPKRFQSLFPENCIFTTNPSYIDIEGVKVLAYHGRSMDEFIMQFDNINYERPILAMEEMIKRRHLAPSYGGKIPLAPEREDYLVMDNPMDIFVTGHVHTYDVKDYQGMLLINTSCWQGQTEYQKTNGIEPYPGIVTAVNLKEWKVKKIDFRNLV